jgi:hypothetical protein
MSTEPEKPASDNDVLAMFGRIPVEMLERTAYQLLGATRTVSMGRDREPVSEADNAVRLRVWETIIEHRVGAPAQRKPIEHKPASDQGKPSPGMLRKGKGATSGSGEGESPTTKGGA